MPSFDFAEPQAPRGRGGEAFWPTEAKAPPGGETGFEQRWEREISKKIARKFISGLQDSAPWTGLSRVNPALHGSPAASAPGELRSLRFYPPVCHRLRPNILRNYPK